MENTLFLSTMEKEAKGQQGSWKREEEEIMKLLTAFISCGGKAKTIAVSWVNFCTLHITRNPFINHRQTHLPCSLVKTGVVLPLVIALVLFGTCTSKKDAWAPSGVHHLVMKSGVTSIYSLLVGFMEGRRGLRLIQVSRRSESCHAALTSCTKMPSDRDLF